MAGKWTPGPWQVVPEDKAVTPFILGDAEGGSIADFTPIGPWQTEVECAANVKLAAAAPEMVELLERALSRIACDNACDWYDDTGCDCGAHRTELEARALLAKIKGK